MFISYKYIYIVCYMYVAHLAVSMPSQWLYIFDFMLFTVNSNWQTIYTARRSTKVIFINRNKLFNCTSTQKLVDSFAASFWYVAKNVPDSMQTLPIYLDVAKIECDKNTTQKRDEKQSENGLKTDISNFKLYLCIICKTKE